jgi:ribonuclease Z
LLSLWLIGAAACPATLVAGVVKVVLLGTGGPHPDPQRAGAALLVQANGQRLLFDSGRGVVERLWAAGYAPDEVAQVFLTHLHSDHITGLGDLWLTGRIWRRATPLSVRGPAGTDDLVRNLRAAYRFDLQARDNLDADPVSAARSIDGADITPGLVYERDGVRVTAFAVDHGHVRPAFGYRVDYGGRSVVISGDTRPSEHLMEHARGVDLLVHEVAAASASLLQRNPALERILAYHTTPPQLVEVLKRTKPRLAVLTHLVLAGVDAETVLETVEKGYDGRVALGADLMWIDVGETIVIRHRPQNP